MKRHELIKEQLAEIKYLPPLPSEPIYDFPYDSSEEPDTQILAEMEESPTLSQPEEKRTDKDKENIQSDCSLASNISIPAPVPARRSLRRQRPPPIPPRLSERRTQVTL